MEMSGTDESWPEKAKEIMRIVSEAAGRHALGTPEREVLIGEVDCIRQLITQMEAPAERERQPIGSFLIARSVREHLNIDSALVETVGTLHDAYRRHCNRANRNR